MRTADPDVAAALAGGADALAGLLAQRLLTKPGYGLFTILAPNRAGDYLVRLYSSDPVHYPLGRADRVVDDRWFRRLFAERKPVVGNDPAEIRAWLPDFSDFIAMGHASLLNLPVAVGEETAGVLNLMATEGHFTQAAIETIDIHLPLAALAIFACTAALPRLAFIR